MSEAIKSVNTVATSVAPGVTPVPAFPRKTGRVAPGKAAETPSSKQRSSASTSAGEDQGNFTLHNEIPPELLSLPQTLLSKSAAFAAYLANQAASSMEVITRKRSDAGPRTQSPRIIEVASESNVPSTAVSAVMSMAASTAATTVTRDDGIRGEDGTRLADIWPKTGMLVLTRSSKQAATSSYLENNDEPVYVPVPDSVLASSGVASKLESIKQNVAAKVDKMKDTYYRLMTMVPYSVGMLINVFA